MEIADLVILAAYAMGFLIIYIHQKKRIESLKTQVDSQSDVLSSMQRFISIFKIDEVEKFVELSRKKFLMEKEEDLKKIKKEFKSKIDIKNNVLSIQMLELLMVLTKLSYFVGDKSYFEKSIKEMRKGIAKERALEVLNEAKKQEKSIKKGTPKSIYQLYQWLSASLKSTESKQ